MEFQWPGNLLVQHHQSSNVSSVTAMLLSTLVFLQLGYEFKEQFSPRLVKPLVLTKALHQKYATAITAGSVSSAAITNQGDVYTWVSLSNHLIFPKFHFTFNYLVHTNKSLLCQGGNSDHQLGHGDENNHFTPRCTILLLVRFILVVCFTNYYNQTCASAS